jgi:hypothetical protein
MRTEDREAWAAILISLLSMAVAIWALFRT